MITLIELEKEKEKMINYLNLKVVKRDWHGVADAAMDLREIDAQIGIVLQITEDAQRGDG